MKRLALRAALSSAAVALCALAGAAVAAADTPIKLVVDASQAPMQNVVQTHEVIPVSSGKLTLYYPEWIPGEHGPVGPLANLVSLKMSANGHALEWRREPYNLFAFDVDIPSGVSSLDIDFTYIGATFGRYSSNRLASPNIVVIDWNQNVLYPSTGTMQSVTFDPTLILPGENWQFATALYDAKRTGNHVSWSTTPLERLMDSPLDACINFKSWPIWHDTGSFPGTATLNVCADTPDELDVSPVVVGHYSALVQEMIAMYGARHWHDYHFLLTVSDVMPGEGIEHHESSDDGGVGNYLINPQTLARGGDLLSHEFNHSWDGKYRMPDGLYPKNLQDPYDDSLLWVYEGMTQYYGDVMSYRDGIRDASGWVDHIAGIYANYDEQPGRLWRSLGDTATAGPVQYSAPPGYNAERRGVDFYTEGELLWLKADGIIRAGTNGQKSLDTFARAFFGEANTGPVVKTYNRQDVIDGLNAVYPYDWTGFFHTWVDEIAVHPPDGFTEDGWKFEWASDAPRGGGGAFGGGANLTYSLGFQAGATGMITDVHFGSPGWKAGLGFNNQIIAVNGRTYSDAGLVQAVRDAQKTHQPIQLVVTKNAAYTTISIPYYDGLRYPHLVRVDGTTDRLNDVVKPLRAMAQ